MNYGYESPELIFVAYSDEDIISTSKGIDLPDVPFGMYGEREIL